MITEKILSGKIINNDICQQSSTINDNIFSINLFCYVSAHILTITTFCHNVFKSLKINRYSANLYRPRYISFIRKNDLYRIVLHLLHKLKMMNGQMSKMSQTLKELLTTEKHKH